MDGGEEFLLNLGSMLPLATAAAVAAAVPAAPARVAPAAMPKASRRSRDKLVIVQQVRDNLQRTLAWCVPGRPLLLRMYLAAAG